MPTTIHRNLWGLNHPPYSASHYGSSTRFGWKKCARVISILLD